jgi:hypothetical protein
MDVGVIVGIVGALITLYGAGFATYTYIKKQREKRPQVNIVLKNGATTYPDHIKRALLIDVSNPGEQPVTITSVQLELPNGNSVFMMQQLPGTVRLPVQLTVGQNAMFYMEAYPLAKSLHEGGVSSEVALTAVCWDGTGIKYRSKFLPFDVSYHLARPDQ